MCSLTARIALDRLPSREGAEDAVSIHGNIISSTIDNSFKVDRADMADIAFLRLDGVVYAARTVGKLRIRRREFTASGSRGEK